MKPGSERNSHTTRGFVLVTTLLLMVVFLVFISSYSELSRIELVTTRSSRSSTEGFYAAEAGLNLRADIIRDIFNGYNQPSGTSPNPTDACESGNNGSGDFACTAYSIGKRTAQTYVVEEPGNPISIKIPSGERYGGLSAQEYRYTTNSAGRNGQGELEALLELTFRSRLVPMFQFAAFYDKDLEIAPGPAMTLSGPVHTNGDLYLNANNSLTIQGQVTTAGDLYRGRKNNTSCGGGAVNLYNPLTPLPFTTGNCNGRTAAVAADVAPFNGEVEYQVETVIVPEPDVLDPVAGSEYWDKADLRIILSLDAGNNPDTSVHPTGIEIRNADGTADAARTALLHACTDPSSSLTGNKAVEFRTSFRDRRENAWLRMLEIDMRTLLNCAFTTFDAGTPLLNDNKNIDDSSEGGLVLYFTVIGPDSAANDSEYATRIRNARELQSNNPLAPAVQGVTVVTDQALFSMGHYNSPAAGDDQRIPAAFLADTYNALSEAWHSGVIADPAYDARSDMNLNPNRIAQDTNVNAAILAGTDTTGGVEGTGGWGGGYNGGLENYPRFHERWSGITFRYRGSFVSLDQPRHANGSWGGGNVYNPPVRDWDYDTRFNTASNLPPLAPRFVYLRQELFVRDFDQ